MSLSKEINAITECTICTETFIDPKVLPCLHTFCLKCLESYGKSRKWNGNLNCPICRANFEIQSKKFSDLPFNFFIQKLIEVNNIARGPSSNACDACDEQSSSTTACVYCFDCRQSLCESCCQVHNKLRYNRTHQVAEFGKKQAEELLKVSPTFCELHSDEMVKLFCTDCESTICMLCYAEEHSSHKCSNILKVSDTFLKELETDTSKVSEHIDVCFFEAKKLRNKKAEFLQHVAEKETLVSGMIEKLHGLVDTYGRQILSELRSLKDVKMKEFESEENGTDDRRVILESFKRYSEEVMAKATPADVTRLAVMLKRRARELHAMRLDNDLCSFDIEIASSNMNHLLNGKIRNPVTDVVVRNNRKDQVNPFLSDYTLVSQNSWNQKVVCDMSAIGKELYLLTKGKSAVVGGRKLIGIQIIKMSLLGSYRVYNRSYNSYSNLNLASYTSCYSATVLLKLWASRSSTGKVIQLEVSCLNLTVSEGNLSTTAIFQLEDLDIKQPVNQQHAVQIKAPPKLNSGISGQDCGITFTAQTIVNQSSITINVLGSPNVVSTGAVYQTEQLIGLISDSAQIAVNPNQPYCLKVYDLENLYDCEVHQVATDATVLKISMPDNFTKKDGSSVSRVSLTRCDSVLIRLQLNCKPAAKTSKVPSEREVKISSVGLSESDGTFVSEATLSYQPYLLKQLPESNHKITLKTTQTLINSGFYAIEFEVQIETTPENALKVKVSILDLIAEDGDYQTETTFTVQTNTRFEHRELLRTISLPSTIDPTAMVACPYHHCLYVGDRQSSSVYRAEPTGKLKKWELGEVPTGLSVTLDHTLLVTLSTSSKLKEYNTDGIVLREIQLSGLTNPVHSMKLPDKRFIVIAQKETKNFICVINSERAVAPAKEMILYASKDTTFTDLKTTDAEASASAPEVVQESGGEASAEVSGESKATVIELNEPIHAVVDRFGYVFILTKNDAKIHLLNPQLNYVRELVSLKKHGMSSPSKLFFHDESGVLYASSETGEESVGFHVTEGKVDPSVWKKVEDL